jgi:hypothetical protein
MLLFIVCAITLVGCVPSVHDGPNLGGTNWGMTIDDSVTTWIAFRKDSTYLMFDAELDEYIEGKYSVRGDVVIIREVRGEFDDESGEPRRKEPKEWLLSNGTMGPGFVQVSSPSDQDSLHLPSGRGGNSTWKGRPEH